MLIEVKGERHGRRLTLGAVFYASGQSSVARVGMHLLCVPFGGRYVEVDFGAVVGVIGGGAVDFAEGQLRMVEREFLGAPAVGDVLADQMDELEILARDHRFARV